jgi:hypothetical protein
MLDLHKIRVKNSKAGWLGDYFGTTEQEEAAPLLGDGATMDLN